MALLMFFGKKYMDEDLYKKGFKAVLQEGLTRLIKDLSKVFDEFLENIIDEYVQSYDQKQSKDFMGTMLDTMQSGEAEFQFDRSNIKAILLTMLVVAINTSATTVDWILTELLRHPHVMKKIRKDLEQVVGLERVVEESDLESLKYLDMVVKEGMRLHSVLPLSQREAMEDCLVDGFRIRKGSRITINNYAIQRDPNVWSEPEKFLPERFVGSNIDVRGRNFQFLPFSAGRRSCPAV
ncbi:hypothetical protein P3S67_014337 [Capsicum chacoense]